MDSDWASNVTGRDVMANEQRVPWRPVSTVIWYVTMTGDGRRHVELQQCIMDYMVKFVIILLIIY